MSGPEEELSLVTSDNESDEQSSSMSVNQTDLEQHSTWPSLSSILTLFSASRANQESTESLKDDETIGEELSW